MNCHVSDQFTAPALVELLHQPRTNGFLVRRRKFAAAKGTPDRRGACTELAASEAVQTVLAESVAATQREEVGGSAEAGTAPAGVAWAVEVGLAGGCLVAEEG
jgi:hypothetical protein